MKTVVHNSRSRDRLLHIETDGAIINVRVGLSDAQGRRVTSIEILPGDEERAADADGFYWHLEGNVNSRLVRQDGAS